LEASVLSQPAQIPGPGVRTPLRRLYSDERLIALIRAGDPAAFEALVQRYRARLLSFCRHMLRSQEDAEDVLQEVFAASYRAIMADEREIAVRPWLYKIARNMCLKHIARRRPPAEGGVEELELPAGGTALDAVRMREDLRQVVGDVRELPETQRTALLMREIDGLSYEQIAGAMETTVPGVKSLLVRARVSLAEAAEGRQLSCEVVHVELLGAAEEGVRLSGAARRHARECEVCAAYQAELGVGRRAAAFWPLAPVALVRELLSKLGIGAGAAGAGAGAGAGGAAITTTTLGAIGGKAAVVVATAGLVAAGATNIQHSQHHHRGAPAPVVRSAPAPAAPSARDAYVHRVAPATHVEHKRGAAHKNAAPAPRRDSTTTQLPVTPTTGGGTFPDTPPPADTAPKVAGGDTVPTDPSQQPMGAPEPVQVQGFDPPKDQTADGSTSPTTGDTQPPGG
jgi:RNA polymerase sigma factor (sigma-70 family)